MATTSENPEIDKAQLLRGARVAFVGKLGGHSRREASKLVRGFGGIPVDRIEDSVDLVVVGADELPVDPDNHLDDALLQLAAAGELEIISETQLWQRLGLIESESHVRRLYTPAMLAQLLNVSVANIRRWFRLGLIVPAREINKLPYFDFQEISVAQQLAKLMTAGVSVAQIQHKLSQLAGFLPNGERPLAQLSVLVEGREILLRNGGGLVEPSGQRRIDFESLDSIQEDSGAAVTIALDESQRTIPEGDQPLESYLELAMEFEDDDQAQLAIEVYRAALLAHGTNSEICFRMGELFTLTNELEAARERYFMAIEMEQDYIEARANLGCVLVELGQDELAIAAFQGALEYHDDYPDVHFHLARLHDDHGEQETAEMHWKRFLELAPQSPWAEEARVRLGVAPSPGV